MQQAIIWTNAGPIHWRTYAALGGDELTGQECVVFEVIKVWCSAYIQFVL